MRDLKKKKKKASRVTVSDANGLILSRGGGLGWTLLLQEVGLWKPERQRNKTPTLTLTLPSPVLHADDTPSPFTF